MKLRFGVFEDIPKPLNFVKTSCVYPINGHEFLATTQKGFYRFEGREIRGTYNFKCSTSVLIPELESVVGLSQNTNKFIGFQLFTMEKDNLILDGCDAQHHSVFHMIYSPKSHVIFTVGEGIKTWNLSADSWFQRSNSLPPELGISFRAQFAPKYQTSILHPPVFDYENECILIPTETGLRPFDIDGNMHDPVSLFRFVSMDNSVKGLTNPVRCSAYSKWTNRETGKTKYLTSEVENGLCIWRNCKLKKRINNAGNIILTMQCIDNENVLFIDSRGTIFILNTKTERSFVCYSLPKLPEHLFVYKMVTGTKVVCTMDMEVIILNVEIPWKVWARNVKEARAIVRCPKYNDAARILVITNNSFVKLYSPINGVQVTAATPKSTSQPLASLYDRGVIFDEDGYSLTDENGSRDQLFSALENGYLVGFNTATQPAEEVFSVDLGARFICRIRYEGEWHYAIAARDSDFFIYEYNTLKLKKRCSVRREEILGFFHHMKTDLAVIIYKECTELYDTKRNSSVSVARIQGSYVNAVYGDHIFIGYKTGHLAIISIVDRKIVNPNTDGFQKPHTDMITGFSFGKSFWMTCSMDKTIQLWDYNLMGILRIELPIPIFSVAVLNGKRDILVATDSEIMMIPGDLMFDDIDKEDKVFDNYDKLIDGMNPSSTIMPTEEEEKEESFLLSCKAKAAEERKQNLYRKGSIFAFDSPIQWDREDKKKKKVDEDEIEDEEKKRLLEEMNAITNADGPLYQPTMMTEEKEEEKEKNNEEEETANEEEEKKKKKRKRKEVPLSELLKNEDIDMRPKKKRKKKIRHKKVKEEEEEEDMQDIYNFFNNDEDLEEIKPVKKREKPVFDYILPKYIKEESESYSYDEDDDDEDEVKHKKVKPKKVSHLKAKKISQPKLTRLPSVKSIKTEKTVTPKPKPKPTKKVVDSNATKKNEEKKKKTIKRKPSASTKVVKKKVKHPKTSIKDAPEILNKTMSETEEENEEEQLSDKLNNTITLTSESETDTTKEEQKTNQSPEPEQETMPKPELEEVAKPKTEPKPKPHPIPKPPLQPKESTPVKKERPVPPKISTDINPSPRRIRYIPRSAREHSPKRMSFADKNPGKKTLSQIDPQMSHLLGYKDHYPAYLKNRAPTPPPIRWGNQLISQRLFSPKPKYIEARRRFFEIPPPNVVIDSNAVLSEYGKGWLDLKPLVDKLMNEKKSLSICASSHFSEFSATESRRSSRRRKRANTLNCFNYLYYTEPELEDFEESSPLMRESQKFRLSMNIPKFTSIYDDPQMSVSPLVSPRSRRNSERCKRINFDDWDDYIDSDDEDYEEKESTYTPFWMRVIEKKFSNMNPSPEVIQIQRLLDEKKRAIDHINAFSVKRIIVQPREVVRYVKANANDDLKELINENKKMREREMKRDLRKSIIVKSAFHEETLDRTSFVPSPRSRKSSRRRYSKPVWTSIMQEKNRHIKRERVPLDASMKITSFTLVRPNLH